MTFIVALIFPWSLFMTLGRSVEATLCLILQISILGWIPAAIWAVHILYRNKIA